MEDFYDKVKEILEKYKHLQPDEWNCICYAMFLEYSNEKNKS